MSAAGAKAGRFRELSRANTGLILINGRRALAIAGAIVPASAAYLLWGNQGGLAVARATLTRFSARSIGIAVVLGLLQNALQATRLWLLLPGGRLPWGSVMRAFTFGQVINSFVPARAGDLAKVALVRNAGDAKRSVDAVEQPALVAVAGGVLVADKIVDVLGLFVALVPAAPAVFKSFSFNAISGSRSIPWVVLGSLALGSLFLFFGWSRWKVRNALSQLIQGLSGLTNGRLLLLSTATSAAAWVSEAVIIVCLVWSVGTPINLGEAIGVLAILNLGIAIPISFANIGTFEAALAFGLTRVGIPTPQAIVIAAMHHFVQLSSTIALAAMLWIRSRPAGQAGPFRVRDLDKRRAIDHYTQLSGVYDEHASRGLLRFLRARERRAIQRLARLDDATKRTMIDVGCGGGFYALAAKRAGLHVTVVDVAPAMVQALSGKTDEGFCCDIEDLSSDRTYDIVICAGVLDFVLNPERAFRNVANLTAKGGRLVVFAPCCEGFGWVYRLEKKLLGIDVNLFSLSWFQAQARECGLVIDACTCPLPSNRVIAFHRHLSEAVASEAGTTGCRPDAS